MKGLNTTWAKAPLQIIILIAVLLNGMNAFSQNYEEPDFIYDGTIIQSDKKIPFTAFSAHLDKYLDWGHNQENAIRIKEKGKEGTISVIKEVPFQVIIKTGNNSVSPSQLFSIVPFKQKKKERHIDFIGFLPRQNSISTSTSTSRYVNGDIHTSTVSGTTFTAMPTYEDRFPESIVRITGKKLGEQSYILNVPPLEKGEYALCFKNGNHEIMIVDLSVK